MILADTSVWIGHLRAPLLEAGRILIHPVVVGEVALGSLRRRAIILAAPADLPRAAVASEAEVMAMIEHRALQGRGFGWVDAHLLAAVALTPGSRLLTSDRRPGAAAEALGAGTR